MVRQKEKKIFEKKGGILGRRHFIHSILPQFEVKAFFVKEQHDFGTKTRKPEIDSK